MHRVNIGCGMSPTQGWLNFDNSLSIKLSRFPLVSNVLHKAKLINQEQMALIKFLSENRVSLADGTKKIPLPDGSVGVLYSSHMVEHLDREEAKRFLHEAWRVLAPGGIIRLAVPDIKKQVKQYLETGDADQFVEATYLTVSRPRRFSERLRLVLIGARHHHWMYDEKSLCMLLQKCGFKDAASIEPGRTRISDPGSLDLRERESESLYVEATK
jgi:predicted SAM-dependent methyltransferase